MTHKHIHIDQALPLVRKADKGHNRWHPDHGPAVRSASGGAVEMGTADGLDGQIKPGTTAADLAGIEMGRVHPLTGPVHVDGAEPGDLLAVKIEQIVPANRGFTMIMPGFGFLRDLFTTPFLVHWEMANGFAVSPQLPGVRIPGAPFMGVMGVAPSHELSYELPGHAHHNAPGVHGAFGVTPSKGYYAATGMSLRGDGRAESEDITLAARNALINMIDYIADAYSFTREQAYCLASVAVDLRISQVVDVPNMTVSAVLPLDIFERQA